MSPLTNREVGERIRYIRQQKGVSAEYVAERLGMSKSNFTKYERGVAKRIDREFILSVARILNVDVSELIGFDNGDQTEEISKINLSPDQKWLFDSIAKADPKKASRLRKLMELIDDEEEHNNN